MYVCTCTCMHVSFSFLIQEGGVKIGRKEERGWLFPCLGKMSGVFFFLLLVCFWCLKDFLSHNNVLHSIVCLGIGREMGKERLRGRHFLTQISFRKELYRSWGSGN